MTEITYRGWKVDRQREDRWYASKPGMPLMGPYKSLEKLNEAIDAVCEAHPMRWADAPRREWQKPAIPAPPEPRVTIGHKSRPNAFSTVVLGLLGWVVLVAACIGVAEAVRHWVGL